MTARTYVARFVDELAALLPDDVTVSDAGGGLVAIERGDAAAYVWAPRAGVDRRHAVKPADTRAALMRAADKLSREIPCYVPEYVEPARELVAILREAATMTAPVVITTRHMPATDVLPARIRARSGGRSLVVPRDDASPDPHASAAAQLASIIMGRILELVDVRRTGDVTRGYRFEVDPDPRIGEVSGPCTVCGRDDIVTGLGDEPRCSRHADYGQATDNDDETQAYAAQREADLMAAAETLSHPDGAP